MTMTITMTKVYQWMCDDRMAYFCSVVLRLIIPKGLDFDRFETPLSLYELVLTFKNCCWHDLTDKKCVLYSEYRKEVGLDHGGPCRGKCFQVASPYTFPCRSVRVPVGSHFAKSDFVRINAFAQLPLQLMLRFQLPSSLLQSAPMGVSIYVPMPVCLSASYSHQCSCPLGNDQQPSRLMLRFQLPSPLLQSAPMSVEALRAELSELSGEVSRRRSEVSSKRQMLLDWKRVVTEGWRLNKDEIEQEVEQAILKIRAVTNSLTKDT